MNNIPNNAPSARQPDLSRHTVLVLGAKGRFGQAAVAAFAAAGWQVIAQARSAFTQPLPAGVESLIVDALDTRRVIAAVPTAQVIVHALNPDYARWEQLLPPVTAAVLGIARATGGLLMVPGNVYNFGAHLPPLLHEDTPFVADTPKAGQRIAMENSLAAAAEQGVRSVIIRAGDFIGGYGTWLDMAITKSVAKGSVTHMGPDDLTHAWAYLPDLAQVFVRVANQRQHLSGCQRLHYAGITATGRQLHAALEALAGRPLKAKAMPWHIVKLIALFSPLLRAALPMRYLWQRPHQLCGTRLEPLIGPHPASTLSQALAEYVVPPTQLKSTRPSQSRAS